MATSDLSGTSTRRRIKGLAAFLAIVWGVAGSFALIDYIALKGFDTLADYGDASGSSLRLSSAVQNSQSCRADASQDLPARGDMRAAAFMLGVQTGLHTRASLLVADSEHAADQQSRNWAAGMRPMVDSADAEITRIAATLGVPRPAPFTPADAATINTDFVPFVESESNHTVRAIAQRRGSDACELYKMGAYWGFSFLVRAALPGERNIYAAEIGHYARRRGIPEPVWRPMIARTRPDATTSDLYAEGSALTSSMAASLQASR